MTKYAKILWDASKKVWILPDDSTSPSFDWEKFHKFGDHLEFKTINKPKERTLPITASQYYEKYYGRRSRPNKVDKVIDSLIGKTNVTDPPKTALAAAITGNRRIVIKHK